MVKFRVMCTLRQHFNATSCNIVGCPVVICCNMLDHIWKWSTFSCNILDVASCCTCLVTFTQHCCTRACALGPLVVRQGPGAHKHWHVALKKLKMLRAFGQPVFFLSFFLYLFIFRNWVELLAHFGFCLRKVISTCNIGRLYYNLYSGTY